jgi:hypothetical protein
MGPFPPTVTRKLSVSLCVFSFSPRKAAITLRTAEKTAKVVVCDDDDVILMPNTFVWTDDVVIREDDVS